MLRAVAALAAAIALASVPPPAAPRAAIDAVVQQAMRDAATPGASIAVAIGGTPVYAQGYGVADDRGTPVTAETIFQMGSISKQFVAAAILQLADAGRVRLDAPIGTYLPAFAKFRNLTVRDALRQTSGLVEFNTVPYILDEKMIYANGRVDRSPLLERLAGQPLQFRPGARFQYSNTNYLVLGEIVGRVTRVPFQTYLRDHFFRPLGMSHTTAGSEHLRAAVASAGFIPIYGFPVVTPNENPDWEAGAGALQSTPADLLRWDDALLGGRLFSRTALAAMTTPFKAGYGFGVVIGRAPRVVEIWHNGATSNAHSMLIRYVAQHLTVAVAGNTQKFPAEFVAGRIARIIDPALPPIDPRLVTVLHVPRNGIIGLIGGVLPLLTLLLTRRGWWRWLVAPFATVLLLLAGVVIPLYSGLTGIALTAVLLLPAFLRRFRPLPRGA